MSDAAKHPGGRPRLGVDTEAARRMRQDGASWAEIAEPLGVSRTTARRLAEGVPKFGACLSGKPLPITDDERRRLDEIAASIVDRGAP